MSHLFSKLLEAFSFQQLSGYWSLLVSRYRKETFSYKYSLKTVHSAIKGHLAAFEDIAKGFPLVAQQLQIQEMELISNSCYKLVTMLPYKHIIYSVMVSHFIHGVISPTQELFKMFVLYISPLLSYKLNFVWCFLISSQLISTQNSKCYVIVITFIILVL